MPRPERPVDPAAGPVEEFAASLRKLRAEAGNPTYRQMAGRVPASKASLSAAAAGHRLPTWEVAREYARACGGDLEEWHGRWSEAAAALGRPVRSTAVVRPARRRPAVLAAVPLLIALAILAWVATAVRSESATPTAAASSAPGPAPTRSVDLAAVADHADPKKSGCATGVNAARITSLDRVEVNTAAHQLLGELVLRHSPACHTSWGKFEPSNRMLYLHEPATITVTARRPATGTVSNPYRTPFDGQAVFGAMLLDHQGCVEVEVQVESPAGGGVATTRCRR